MNNIIRDAAIACAFAFTFGATWAGAPAPFPNRLDSAQAAAWRNDLGYMARAMGCRHRNPYHTISQAEFDSAVAALDRRIPANAYDSLDEAYMLTGRRERAITNYRKSLVLDPRNENARAMLEKLGRAELRLKAIPPTRPGVPAPGRCGGARARPPWPA